VRLPILPVAMILIVLFAISISAQQATEQRVALSEAAVGLDAKSAPAIEARLLTTGLNGSEESPVTNVRLAIRNTTANFYTFVSGWATFYDANAVRCGEGQFKVDALAPQEAAETDTPGLRLRCVPTSWRVTASNLMMRSVEMPPVAPAAVTAPTPPPPAPADTTPSEKPVPINFIISIDGEEHPIQINNPVVLKLGNRNRRIILKSAQ
jgi:hypothetical protein